MYARVHLRPGVRTINRSAEVGSLGSGCNPEPMKAHNAALWHSGKQVQARDMHTECQVTRALHYKV